MNRLRTAASLAAGALAVTGLALGPAPAGAADPAPPTLTMMVPDKVYAEGYDGEVYLYAAGTLVTGETGFSIWAHRPDWSSPISAQLVSDAGTVALPAKAMTDFTGLRFFTYSLTSVKTGEVVKRWKGNLCVTGGQRVTPDAEPRNPYPDYCPYNPYTKGSVQGMPAHYATALPIQNRRALKLDETRYDLTITVRPAMAELFSMTETSVTTRMIVKSYDGRPKPPKVQVPTRPTEAPHRHEPTEPSSGSFDGPQPDLQSLPAFGITLNRKGTALRFGANVWNAGPSPLVVEGFRDDLEQDHMTAYQYFYDADGNELGHEQVGELHWHEGNHNHWHFDDFATYRLLKADKSTAVRSTKNSFGLANTDAVDYTVPGADWHPEGTDLGSACGGREALSVREVLSSGSGDTYFQFRTGQAFRLGNLPDGIYFIQVLANPEGNLIEESTTNNSSLRKIKLSTKADGERKVKVFQKGSIVETDDYYGY
jgi:hypothetical protein